MDGTLTIGLHMIALRESSRRRIDGVLEYVAEHPGFKVADFCFLSDRPDTSRLPPWLGHTDGVVVCVPRLPGIVTWLRRGRVPLVAVDADLRKDLMSVVATPRSMAKLAVEHMLKLGTRQFAYVGFRHTDGSRHRKQALANELDKHGLGLEAYETENRLTGTYEDYNSLSDLEPGLVHLISHTKKPLAVVAMNDGIAVTVCRIARDLGMTVPDDVAVLGVGDSEIARVSTPPVSSIRPAMERQGYEAARLLHRLIRGERPARHTVEVNAQALVARQSTVGQQRAMVTDIDAALEFIRQRTCEGILVQHVADHVRLPLRTFELQFSAAIGHTPGEEIRRVRLARVKTLLETTDLSLASVANMVSMNTVASLNHFFRRWADTTPGRYRQEHRGKTAAKG